MEDNKKTVISEIERAIDNQVLSNKEIALYQLNEITKKLPPAINELLQEAFTHKRIPKEYFLSSVFYAYANASGLAFKINCMSYTNYPNLYFAIIGSRGDVKSPAMELACAPLIDSDTEEYAAYNKRKAETFDQDSESIKRKHLLIQNATIEGAMYVHYQNPYSIGIFVDELYYIFEKMANKNSSEGAEWRIFLLQGNTNSYIDIVRKTTLSYRVNKSCPSLLGSIQHQFIPKMFANGNLESGLMDRFLFTTKLTDNNKISKLPIPEGIIANYEDCLSNLLNYRRKIEDSQQELFINFENEAYSKMHVYSQSILDRKQREQGPECEYMSKMMISIHKLVLLCHLMNKSRDNSYQNKISLETVELAILINEYHFTHFKIVMESGDKEVDNKQFNTELIKRGVKNNVPQTEIIKLTGLSAGQVSKLSKKHKN